MFNKEEYLARLDVTIREEAEEMAEREGMSTEQAEAVIRKRIESGEIQHHLDSPWCEHSKVLLYGVGV